jgi:hypothetical protein
VRGCHDARGLASLGLAGGTWSLFTLAVVIAVLGWLVASRGVESVHLYLAMALGVGLTMELGGALMALAFLSSGTGHDEAVRDFTPDNQDSDG